MGENLKKEYEQNLKIFESMKPESEFYHGETNIQTLDEKLKKLKIKIEFFEADTKHYKSQIENVSFEINKLQAPIIKNLENQIQNLTKELEFEKQKFENQKLDFDELYSKLYDTIEKNNEQIKSFEKSKKRKKKNSSKKSKSEKVK